MERIDRLDAFALSIPRETPYLGALDPGVAPNGQGHFVRPGNRSVYSVADHSVLVRATTNGGAVGWGECVTVVAPEVVVSILESLVFPLVLGRNPHDAELIYDDLYDAVRVRGLSGGMYHDALAALDIALWDLKGKLTAQPLCTLLGGCRRSRIPAYVSGLPAQGLAARAELAAQWMERGFRAVKFAAAVASEGVVREMAALRERLGPEPEILVDLHWRYSAAEAITLIRELEKYRLALAEAPVASEDIEGQARVAAAVDTPVGLGEEWRTVYEYLPRCERRAMDVIQPEMGRTGITSFQRICTLAEAFHLRVMPHASIGIGIFQAASLHASARLRNLPYHEYQHSIFDRNLRFITGTMSCAAGEFHLPEGVGLGVEPSDEVWEYLLRRKDDSLNG